MIKSISQKILGWCPRFNTVKLQLIPYPSLPAAGKRALVALLAGWALLTAYKGWILVDYYLGALSSKFDPSFLPGLTLGLFEVASGLILTLVMVDFFHSGEIHYRHKLELAGLFVLQVLALVISDVYGAFLQFNLGVLSLSVSVATLIQAVAQIALYLYVVYRLITGGSVLTRTTLLLLSAASIILPLSPLIALLESSGVHPWYIGQLLLLTLACILVSFTSMRVYLLSKETVQYEVTIPSYVRASILIYGLAGAGIMIVNLLVVLVPFDFSLFAIQLLYIVFYLGIVAVSLFPLKFMIGEEK